METPTQNLSDLTNKGKKYVQNQIEYAELKALDKGSAALANIITDAIVVICGLMAFLFATITLGFYLSTLFGSYTQGFGAVALIYTVIAIIVSITRDNYIEKFIVNRIIKKYKNEKGDK